MFRKSLFGMLAVVATVLYMPWAGATNAVAYDLGFTPATIATNVWFAPPSTPMPNVGTDARMSDYMKTSIQTAKFGADPGGLVATGPALKRGKAIVAGIRYAVGAGGWRSTG